MKINFKGKKEKCKEKVKLLEKENEKLKGIIQELSILNDIAVAISFTLSLEKIINLIVDKCIKHFEVEQGAIMLVAERSKMDQPALYTMVRRIDQTNYIMPFRLNEQLIGWMLKNTKPLIINDFSTNQFFQNTDSSRFVIHSLLAVPLIIKNKMIGVLALFNKKNKKGFTDGDQRLLSIIATESTQVIENARLYKQEQEFKRIKEELRMAFKIQRDLLPKELPKIKNYEISAVNIPARSVSGDYYDFEKDNNLVHFCLGDVSGKGMPAALLAANLQATLRGQALLNSFITDTLKNTNYILYNNTSPEKFATLFYGVLDPINNKLKYSNAGHNPPFFVQTNKNKIKRLEKGGMILGIMEDSEYEEETVHFEKGDLLLIYSDGISEAMNEKEEEFGEKNIETFISKDTDKSAKEITDTLLEEVKKFVGKTPQSDDMTIIAIKRIN